MKKTVFLCFLLVLALSFSGCITLRFEEVMPDVQAPVEGLLPDSVQTETPATQSNLSNVANWSKEEIIAFFCNAVNLAKGNTVNYTMQKAQRHDVTFLGTTDGQMPRMAETVVKKLNRNEHHTYTVTGGMAASDTGSVPVTELIAPKGALFMLHDTQVTSAKASFDGTNVIIALTLADDTANAQQPVPAIHGELIPYLSFRGQDLTPYTVQTAQLDYTNISLAAGIDASGRLVSLSASADVAGIGVGAFTIMTTEASFSATVKETCSFTY